MHTEPHRRFSHKTHNIAGQNSLWVGEVWGEVWRENRTDQYFPSPAAGTVRVLRSEKAFVVSVVDWNLHTPMAAHTIVHISVERAQRAFLVHPVSPGALAHLGRANKILHAHKTVSERIQAW